MKKLLFHLDTDPMPSVFDTVVAHDGGADHVHGYGGVTTENCVALVAGTIFTRGDKKFSAIFVSGSNMQAGEQLFEAIKKQFFGDFRVSIMLDSNGSNTTAAAMVAQMSKAKPLAGKRAVVLAGTGPVGQRAGVMMAREGTEVILTSRKLDRAEVACAAMNKAFGVELKPMAVTDEASTARALAGAHLVLATGAAGVQLLPEKLWKDHPTLEMLSDANATPPLGFEGIKAKDKGENRHGKLVFGALGVGNLKLALHRACIGKLFEANNQVFDATEIYAIAKTMA
ncbi:MAG TPA: methylene-tetrahydromethanopterin dehydrogenase N-terminal domain-containing protein [Gammaproteobacteria bacterium]|nr:methylene-tetrahydromethanopterin dehydrogenase N-terminal domain-containing protein [Gammaproteobacteria bacterium]